jgi:hypothetical protein
MPHLDGSFLVLGVFIFLLLLTRPMLRRVVVQMVRRATDWAATHWHRADEGDSEEDQLWLVERRGRLCADLRRVEHLVATDAWMSATRQRANRIAYQQLVEDLRHTPDVFPTSYQPQTVDLWHESTIDPRSTVLRTDGFAAQRRTVEVLEIGWGRPRRH